MRTLWHELEVAVRQCRETPGAFVGLTVAIVLSVGANLAVATRLRDVLAPPGAVILSKAGTYVIEAQTGYTRFKATEPDMRRLSNADFEEMARGQDVFERIGAFNTSFVCVMSGGARPRITARIFVTAEALDVLGTKLILGRSLGAPDFTPGAPNVALITDRTWRATYGSDPAIIGRSIALDEQPFEIVGVAAEVGEALHPVRDLFGGSSSLTDSVITPLLRGRAGESERTIDYLTRAEDQPFLTVAGRLRPGVSRTSADTWLSLVSRQLQARHPTRSPEFTLRTVEPSAWRAGGVRPLLALVTVTALIVLLVACANAAALLVAETAQRLPELATRAALGASGRDFARLLSIRALVWSVPGGVLAWVAVQVIGQPHSEHATGFLLAVMTITTAAVALSMAGGAIQALRRHDLMAELRGHAQTGTRPALRRTGVILLTLQVAAAVALTIDAGMLVRSVWQMTASYDGFMRRDAFVIEVRLPRSRYRGVRQQSAFFERALTQVTLLPGVDAAAFSSSPPLTGAAASLNGDLGLRTPSGMRTFDRVNAQFVTSGYRAALGMSVVQGRFLSPQEDRADDNGIVVDQTFCQTMLHGEDPLRSELYFAGEPLPIVGVVRDLRQSVDPGAVNGLLPSNGMVYLPIRRYSSAPNWRFLVVRTSHAAPRNIADTVATRLRALDATVLVDDPASFDRLLARRSQGQRALCTLLVLLALIVAVLASTNVTASISRTISMRRRDVALRLCFGATRAHILLLTLRTVGVAAGMGVAGGIAGGLLLGRTASHQLYGVHLLDPLQWAAIVTALVGLAAFAVFVPLRRVWRIDPARTLRSV
jgi:predicted permease